VRCLLVVVNGLSTQVINKPSALNVARSLHYYNLNPSMEDRTGSTSQVASSCEPRTAKAADFSDQAADFSAINLSRACCTGSQHFTEPSCSPTMVASFSEPRTAQAADFSVQAADFSATNLSRACCTGSQQLTEPSCSLKPNHSRPLFDARSFLASNLPQLRLKYPGVADRFFLEGVENLRLFHQGMEKDLLISRPLFDARSFVEPVSIVEPRGELNSAGSLVLNSADNTSSPGDSGVPAEPLISGGNIASLAARDWRCSEENLLVGNLSAGVGTVSVQSGMAVDIPAQPDAAATVISEQFGMLTGISEQPALVSRFISEQPGVVPGVCVQLPAVNIPEQPDAAAAVISEQPRMSTSISEQSALDSSFISEQPGVIPGVDAQLLAVVSDTSEQPKMAVAHASEQSGVERDLLNSAMRSDDIVLSISSPASMCVRSDVDGSVGAVSSDLGVHACSSGSDDHMSSVVRSADSSCVSSSDIFSSKVSDVRYMCGGRSDGSVSNISSPAIAAGSEADADRALRTFADAVFETAAASKTVDDCSVLMIGVEEFIPYRDVIDPLDLESSCLVLDPCQAVTNVCNHCESPPDEDGFCDGLCYSCFVLLEEQVSTCSSCSSSDGESYEADDIFVCSACGADPDENGLFCGLCSRCFLQHYTEPAVDWSVMEESDVSRVVVGCFSDASLRDTDSDQHIDMVQCIWHELMDIADIQSADLDAMVYSVEEMLDQLPVGYYAGGRRELLDVFIELMTMFTSWSV
jgi:hypothetical protein